MKRFEETFRRLLSVFSLDCGRVKKCNASTFWHENQRIILGRGLGYSTKGTHSAVNHSLTKFTSQLENVVNYNPISVQFGTNSTKSCDLEFLLITEHFCMIFVGGTKNCFNWAFFTRRRETSHHLCATVKNTEQKVYNY